MVVAIVKQENYYTMTSYEALLRQFRNLKNK